MAIISVGMDYHTASVQVREKFSPNPALIQQLLHELGTALRSPANLELDSPASPADEAVIVSTCNRFEMYAMVANPYHGWSTLERFIAQRQGYAPEELRPHLQYREGRAVAEHLMRLGAGLESMVLGEPQILGQLVDAHTAALDSHSTGPILSHLFSHAIHVGKRARTETTINSHTTSIAHVGVLLARKQRGTLADARVLVVGAGEMAQLAAQGARTYGAASITCINRTLAKAQKLAEKVQAQAVDWSQLPQALAWADVVITATGCAEPIFDLDNVAAVLPAREQRPLLFVDIALPRNVAPDVTALPNVLCYDIDQLQNIVDANIAERRAAVPLVERIVAEETGRFVEWLHTREVVPVIVNFRRKVTDIADDEVKQAMQRLSQFDQRDQQVIRRLAHRIVNKLLHDPTIRLKECANTGSGSFYAHVFSELFALTPPAEAPQQLPTLLENVQLKSLSLDAL